MKKIKLLLLLTIIVGCNATAQTYRIDTSQVSFEKKLRPCFAVRYDASSKTVKKAWDDFFKKNHDVKIKGIGFMTNKDMITATDISIAGISDKRMDMYALVEDVSGGSELKYFMSFGYDFFIGPDNYAAEFAGMKKMLNDFSMEFLIDFYGSEASRVTKEIKELEKDISKNNKTIKKNTRKARKKSSDVASGMQAKNTSLHMENEQKKTKITELGKEIELIKVKQAGISRN